MLYAGQSHTTRQSYKRVEGAATPNGVAAVSPRKAHDGHDGPSRWIMLRGADNPHGEHHDRSNETPVTASDDDG